MNELELILPYIMTTVIFTIVTIILINLFNFILRKRLITQVPLDDKALDFLNKLSGVGAESLKWGLILFFGGLGLVVLEYVPYNAGHSSLPYGLEAMFLAAGFLVYFLIMRKEQKKTP